MKRILNNLLYDTDESTEVWKDESKNKAYYKTSKGNYFVVINDKEINPISEDTVKEILGVYSVEKYVEIFGKPEEA